MPSISKWNFFENFVQGGMRDGEFLSAAYTLIAAGPPRLAHLTGAAAVGTAFAGGGSLVDQVAYPIGVLQNFNLAHNRQFARIFEIGSERSYFIAGRTIGQITLGRVLYHGPSLLRVMYAYYSGVGVIPLFQTLASGTGIHHGNIVIPPGYENLYLNLASDLFCQPIGLLVYMKDSNAETYGAVYFEGCYIPNHTIATDAQGIIMQESVAIQFERCFPLALNAVSLVTGF
jgi:hypothetical protein